MRIVLPSRKECNWPVIGVILIIGVAVLAISARGYQPAIDQEAVEAARILTLEELAERKAKEIALREAELSNHLEALTEAHASLEQNKERPGRDRDDWYSWVANADHCWRLMKLDQEILYLRGEIDDFRAEKEEMRGTREGILRTIEMFLADHQGRSEVMLIRGQSRRLASFLIRNNRPGLKLWATIDLMYLKVHKILKVAPFRGLLSCSPGIHAWAILPLGVF
jgi:hypothetical protein